MQCPNRAILILSAALGLSACSDRSPAAPDVAEDPRFAIQSSPGSYAIFFMKQNYPGGLIAAADAEPVGTYLVLRSEIRDNAGNLAQTGTVTYEVCMVGAEKVSSANCTSGSGTWKRWGSGSVDPIGTRFGFGSCSTPRTIGFRVKYAAKNGAIAGGVSAPRDFSWY